MPEKVFVKVEEVYDILRRSIRPTGRTIEVPLDEALGRFLAADIRSSVNVPPFNTSAMDGYSFHSSLLKGRGKEDILNLKLVGASFAGHPFEGVAAADKAVKVMTGGAVPKGHDTLIQRERLAEEAEGHIAFAVGSVKPKANIRLKAEEIAEGDVVIKAGTMLDAAAIGLAASLGYGTLPCREIRVAVYSTGDELVAPGAGEASSAAGKIYDANSHLLTALASGWGATTVNYGILPDDPDEQIAKLNAALEANDIILTSGGVGEGDKDFTAQILAERFNIERFSIMMRPGKPFSFGVMNNGEALKYFFAFPGNPVAAAMSATLYLREALYLAANGNAPCSKFAMRLAASIRGRKGRRDFVRGAVHFENGIYAFTPAKSQSSAMLTSLFRQNAVVILDEETDGAAVGETVEGLWIS